MEVEKWNGNLYNINKIKYMPAALRSYPLLEVTTYLYWYLVFVVRPTDRTSAAQGLF